MINNIYSLSSHNSNYFLPFDDNERTVTKVEKKLQWTPEKMKNFKENEMIGDNDTTLTGITLNTTYNKSNISMSIDTPLKKRKPTSQAYEASIRTPIKKTKKRDCTPEYSDEDEEKKKMIRITSDDNNYHMKVLNCNRNILFNDNNPNLSNSFNETNQMRNYNYNLLKANYNNSSYNNAFHETSNFYKPDIRFQKISKSKFLQKIDALEEINSSMNRSSDFIESEDILDKIKGNYLLYQLENEVNRSMHNLFSSIIEDNELFNKITNLICYSFFTGFNNRSDMFFKFLSPNIYLEIVDQPLNSFENNLSLLTNHVLSLDPIYDNSQIDYLPDECKYIFSLKGNSILNTQNKEVFNFIVSLRICLNINDENRIRSNSIKLQEIVWIDFVKIKIFSEN